MPSVIARAIRTLRDLDGVIFEATDDTIAVPPATDVGFAVRLQMVHARQYVVSFDGWRHTFDRAEDALDCFEYGLSDSCRLRVTLRGDRPVRWNVEKREFGMWVPGLHPTSTPSLAFWRPQRTEYRQNQVFRQAVPSGEPNA